MNPDEYWPSLERDCRSLAAGEMVARRINTAGVCDLRLVVQAPDEQRMLVALVDVATLSSNSVLPASRGFETQRIQLPSGPPSLAAIAVKLTAPVYSNLFSALVADVVNVVGRVSDPRRIANVLLERLTAWQGFMQKSGPDGLDTAEQIGLYGELRFLLDFVVPAIGPDAGVAAWTGPGGTPQDFECGPSAFEIKTTAGAAPVVHISNPSQLDNSASDNLFLVHHSVDRRNGYGQTLADLVDLARSSVAMSASALECLESRLFEVGFLEMHREHYRRSGYTDKVRRVYRVFDSFPRIVPSALPSGVQDVTYDIHTAALQPFEVPLSLITSSLKPLPS